MNTDPNCISLLNCSGEVTVLILHQCSHYWSDSSGEFVYYYIGDMPTMPQENKWSKNHCFAVIGNVRFIKSNQLTDQPHHSSTSITSGRIPSPSKEHSTCVRYMLIIFFAAIITIRSKNEL